MQSFACAVGDEQHVAAALGHALEARRGVGGVAEGGVLDALLGADVAGHHRAAVDADAHHESVVVAVLCDPRVECVEARVDHLGGGGERTIGVVGLLERRAEHGHDAVAHVGDQRAAGAEDRLGHLVEIAC